jgi:hypothetical protein
MHAFVAAAIVPSSLFKAKADIFLYSFAFDAEE